VNEHAPIPWTTQYHATKNNKYAAGNWRILGADRKHSTRVADVPVWRCGEFDGNENGELPKANAAFIIKAVNAHDKLVEACQQAIPFCKLAESHYSTRYQEDAIAATNALLDALAAARGDEP